jgi:hypothetical protein
MLVNTERERKKEKIATSLMSWVKLLIFLFCFVDELASLNFV